MKQMSKRAEIISCAARLFRKRGFSATSVRDIAREMGMEASSLYNHIKSKQELLSSLLLDIAHTFSEGMESIETASIPAYQKLERLVALHVRISVEKTDAVSLVPSEWIHLDTDSIKQFLALRDEYDKTFKAILSACIKEGSIKSVNVDLAAFSILSSLRWLYSWYSKNQNINIVELEEEMKSYLLKGLVQNT